MARGGAITIKVSEEAKEILVRYETLYINFEKLVDRLEGILKQTYGTTILDTASEG